MSLVPSERLGGRNGSIVVPRMEGTSAKRLVPGEETLSGIGFRGLIKTVKELLAIILSLSLFLSSTKDLTQFDHIPPSRILLKPTYSYSPGSEVAFYREGKTGDS